MQRLLLELVARRVRAVDLSIVDSDPHACNIVLLAAAAYCRYTRWHMLHFLEDFIVSTNYMDYIQKLTGLKINELVEASEDWETGHELVVARVDPQPPG